MAKDSETLAAAIKEYAGSGRLSDDTSKALDKILGVDVEEEEEEKEEIKSAGIRKR